MRRLFTLLFLLPIVAAPLFAADDDEDKPPPFPGKGSAIPGPYHVLNVSGPRKGRFHCLVCRNGLSPTAAVFIQPPVGEDAKEGEMLSWVKENLADDAQLCKLFKKLDTVIDKNPDAYLGAYAIFFAPEKHFAPLVNRLEELPKALELKHIIFAVGKEDEPKSLVGDKEYKAWFDKKDFAIGTLVYNRYKIVHWQPFAEGKLGEKEIAAVVKEYDALVPDYARPDYKKKLKLPKQ